MKIAIFENETIGRCRKIDFFSIKKTSIKEVFLMVRELKRLSN